jgi:hypothetical protein
LERLAARGESLRGHTARLLALLDDYGRQELAAAVTQALERTPSAPARLPTSWKLAAASVARSRPCPWRYQIGPGSGISI